MSENKKIIIRVDGSHKLGFGHVRRCLYLAEVLKGHGHDPLFLTKNSDSKVINLIKNHGFVVETLDPALSIERDMVVTAETVKRYSSQWLVLDTSHTLNLNRRGYYEDACAELCKQVPLTLAIDDPFKIDAPFDLHVIPYYGCEKIHYTFFPETEYLLGCRYFMLSNQWMKGTRPIKDVKEKANQILIMMGGSDSKGLTLFVMNALKRLGSPQLEVRIVVGPCFEASLIERLGKEAKSIEHNIKLYFDADMYQLMGWADVVITGGGLSKYEAAASGTPNVIISSFDLEAERADIFAQAGSAIHLGHFEQINEGRVVEQLEQLFHDRSVREAMSLNGLELVDGKGAERVVQQINKRTFHEIQS